MMDEKKIKEKKDLFENKQKKYQKNIDKLQKKIEKLKNKCEHGKYLYNIGDIIDYGYKGTYLIVSKKCFYCDEEGRIRIRFESFKNDLNISGRKDLFLPKRIRNKVIKKIKRWDE